jgi:HEAT repeat protein
VKIAALVLTSLLGQAALGQSYVISDSSPTQSCRVDQSVSGLTDDERVTAVIERTLHSGESVTPDGIHAITFVPPSNCDRAEIRSMGVRAVAPLARFVDSPNNFAQLIAVRLLAEIGGPETAAPLERALDPKMWQPLRLNALYGLGKLDHRLAIPVLQRMAQESDPKIRDTAGSLLQEALR